MKVLRAFAQSSLVDFRQLSSIHC